MRNGSIVTNKLGSSNPNRIPKNKDIKYIELVRKLHNAERNFIASIPMDSLEFTFEENVAWEQLENMHLNKGLTKLQQIELTRLKNIRLNVYMEINELLGNEEFITFIREYMAMDKTTLKPTNPVGNINSVGNVLGGLMTHQTLDYIPIDDMPVTYEVLDKFPIKDGKNKVEAYRVKVNSSETTISHNMFQVMKYVKENYEHKKFHFPELLDTLHFDKEIITSYYDGNPNQLFRTRKGLLHILFKKDDSKEKGFWLSRVKYWI